MPRWWNGEHVSSSGDPELVRSYRYSRGDALQNCRRGNLQYVQLLLSIPTNSGVYELALRNLAGHNADFYKRTYLVGGRRRLCTLGLPLHALSRARYTPPRFFHDALSSQCRFCTMITSRRRPRIASFCSFKTCSGTRCVAAWCSPPRLASKLPFGKQ